VWKRWKAWKTWKACFPRLASRRGKRAENGLPHPDAVNGPFPRFPRVPRLPAAADRLVANQPPTSEREAREEREREREKRRESEWKAWNVWKRWKAWKTWKACFPRLASRRGKHVENGLPHQDAANGPFPRFPRVPRLPAASRRPPHGQPAADERERSKRGERERERERRESKWKTWNVWKRWKTWKTWKSCFPRLASRRGKRVENGLPHPDAVNGPFPRFPRIPRLPAARRVAWNAWQCAGGLVTWSAARAADRATMCSWGCRARVRWRCRRN